MSEALTLPRGWLAARLGSILPIEYGAGLPKARRIEGKFPVYGSNGIVGYHSEALTAGPAIIIGRKGSAGAVQLSTEACWPIDTTYFAVGADDLDLEFFFHLLSHCRLDQLDRSTAVPSLSRDDYNDVQVPVPPLPEQIRIVVKIEELFSDLDAGVAALERVKANLKRYRAAVLKAAVEGRLTEDWRRRHPDTEPASKLLERILAKRRAKWEEAQLRKFKEAGKTPPKGWKEKYETPLAPSAEDASPTPRKWSVATIDQLSHFVTSGSRGWAEHYSEDGPLFIRAQDINCDRLRLDRVAHVRPPSGAEIARTRTAFGDLLVTVTGANVTKTGFVDQELDEAYISQHVAMVRLVLPAGVRYIHAWVICPARGRRTLEKLAYGAGKPGLNLEQVRSLSVWLPPPAEQAEIVAEVDRRLSVADSAEQQIEHALLRAARLRQAILKRAFEGKLVDQDPSDEPGATVRLHIQAGLSGQAGVILKKDKGAGGRSKRRSRAHV